MLKIVSHNSLPHFAVEESAPKIPSKKIPIGWSVLGALAFSVVVWYLLIAIATKIIGHI